MEEKNNIVIYQSEDGLVSMEAMVDSKHETIWATQKAISVLFQVDRSVITRHLKNVFTTGELEEDSACAIFAHTAQDGKTYNTKYYNLDAIISVGYRVNSIRATSFRKWSSSIIKEYMRHGYVVNRNVVSEQKYEDLKRAMGLLENVFNKELLLSSDQVTDLFDVIRDYTYALDTLDAYDYQSLKIADTTAPERFHATYENAMEAIKSLKNKFGGSDLFGVEKDASFHSSIGQMDQNVFLTPAPLPRRGAWGEGNVSLLSLFLRDFAFGDIPPRLRRGFANQHQKSAIEQARCAFLLPLCGGRGIRTPGTLLYNSFQDCRHRPLGHSSNWECKDSEKLFLCKKLPMKQY